MKRSSDERPKPKLKASHVFRDLWELIWPRRNLFLLGLILTFINRAASLVLPGSTKFLIDDVVQKHRQDLLIPIAAAVAGAILIQALTSYTLIRLLSTSAQRLIAEMRIKVQQHIGRLPVRYYDANKTGSLVSRIMSDVEGVRNLIGTGLVDFFGGRGSLPFGRQKIFTTLFIAWSVWMSRSQALWVRLELTKRDWRSWRRFLLSPRRSPPGFESFINHFAICTKS